MIKKSIPFLIAALLLAAAIGWDFFRREAFSEKSIAHQITGNLERELSLLQEDVDKIGNDSAIKWSAFRFPIFLIDSGTIKNWSRNDMAIDAAEMAGDYHVKLLHSPRQDLVLYQKKIDSAQTIVGIVPLRTEYAIVNQYLTTRWNESIFPVQGIGILSSTENTGTSICTSSGRCIFKVIIPENTLAANGISVLVALMAIFFAGWGIYHVVRYFHQRRKFWLSFLLLFLMLAFLRIAMVQFSFPGRWIYSKFFDPKFFASSSFNASVGDFVLNVLIVAIAGAYLFQVYSRLTWIRRSAVMGFTRWLMTPGLLAASFFSFLFPSLFIEAVFHDSSILIDITSDVEFTGLKIMALIAVALSAVSSFFFVHIFVRWAKLISKGVWQFPLSLAAASGLFSLYFLLSELNYWPTLVVGILYFPFIAYSRHFRSLSTISYQTFSFLLVSVIAYASQGAFVVSHFSEEKELRSMFRAANNLINRDVLGEFLLNEAVKGISNDQFIVSGMVGPVGSKDAVRQKVRMIHLNNYFDRYEVKVKLFYADGTGAANESPADLATVIQAVQNEANKTSYENVYFVRSSPSETTKRYLVVVPLKSTFAPAGYVVVDLSLKQIVPQQVYPELLIDNRFSQSIRNKNYSYAFYNQEKLLGNTGNFNFDRDFELKALDKPELYSKGIKVHDAWVVGAEDEIRRQAVVSSGVYPPFYTLANFSFLFVLGVGAIFIFLVGYLITGMGRNIRLNYSARIQVYVYVSFILPLVVVSAIALQMINQSEELQREKEISDRGLQISELIAGSLEPGASSGGFREGVRPHELQSKLVEFSRTDFTDANVYDAGGKLLATSQPGIISNQLLMPLANRTAWEKITGEKFNIVQVRSRVGLLDYNSLFFAIKPAGRNQLLGILELPFFKSNSAPAKVSVLTNILVTFAIVFIMFSIFAFNAIHKLTSPLIFIAKKLKTTSLGHNQQIEWTANDEIGLMVKEYNRMLDNLEESKIDLLKSQKESAWREIAQQVAHEIKNPLTPMKLTLQHMEQALVKEGDERMKKSIQTILAQVDVLNGIAGSFSAFATMPAPVLASVEIVRLLKISISLFESEMGTKIKSEFPAGPVVVSGDEQLLGRIFANLILNALQSGETGKKINVEISVQQEGEWCIIRFLDDGAGIDPSMRDKIFLPHFTTKNTGSGLGLAIAKQGIEQMGGTIWFETATGQGTAFLVKLRISQIWL